MIPVSTPRKLMAMAISFMTVCLFFSCKKTDNINTVIEQPADFSKKVTASVNGFVTNENNQPMPGAKVQYGELQTTTNQFGFFEIKNASVTENAGFVNVTMAGYFNNIKTFLSKEGKSNFCRVKLIPKTVSGYIDGTTGGNVILSNGLAVAVPGNAIVDAITKSVYSGVVNVSSHWINPVADDLDKIMPGDLRGINTDGNVRALTTYGMAAVELTGSSGQLLQIANDKKAILTFPLPTELQGAAPASIPLWYFDETIGLWKEEGTAAKRGNNYVGEVKHFSYWNCDLPNATVQLSFSITDSALNPLSDIHVEITPVSDNSWSHVGGYTDKTGVVQVPVTANTQYKLQLFSNECQIAALSTRMFSVENTDTDLGNIKVGGQFLAKISGTVTDCNNSAISNGHVFMSSENGISIANTNSDGSFSYPMFLCNNNTTQAIFIAQNPSAQQQGQPVNRTVNAGTNNIGNLQACGVSAEQFFNYSINDSSYYFALPFDSVLQIVLDPTRAYIGAYRNTIPASLESGFSFEYSNNMSIDSTFNLIGFQCPQVYIPTQRIPATPVFPIRINFTEFDGVGGFISGNFAGLVQSTPPRTSPINLRCNFRVQRRR